MATELAKAYVQIIPSAQGIQGSISDVLNGEAGSAGESSGKTFAAGLGSAAKKAVAALGIGKIIADGIGGASEFESAMAKTSTLFTGTDEEFAALQSTILGLSGTYGLAATTLAEAAYSAESASVPMEDLGAMLESSAKLATAGFTDIDTALSATAKTMNAYGMSGEEAMEQVQRVLMQTQNYGITTVGELGASLANVTPTAAAMGVSFEQVGAAMALMTAKGVPTAQATTQLRAAMTELGKAGTKADTAFREATKDTKYAGMGFKEAMAAGADLGEVFSLMQKYANESGLSMVDLWGSVEAGNAAMMIASDVETFNRDLEQMSTETDVVGEAYGKMSGTFGNSLNRLKESASNFMTTLFTGGDISGSFDTMLKNLGDVGEKLKDWITTGLTTLAQNLPDMMKSLLDFGESILAALGTVDWITLGTTIVEGIIGAAGELGTRLIGLISTAITSVSNGEVDFGTIGTAILDGATSILGTLGETLKGLFESAAGLLTGEGGILSMFGTVGQSIMDAVNGVLNGDGGNFLSSIFTQAETDIKGINWEELGNNVAKAGSALVNLTGEALAGGFTAAESLISAINWEELGKTVGTVGNSIISLTGEVLSAGFTAAESAIKTIDWTALGSTVGNVGNSIIALTGDVLSAGFTAAEALITGINWAGIGETVATVGNGLINLAGETLAGAFTTAETLISGIDWAGIGTTAASVANGLTSLAGETLAGAFTSAKSLIETIDWAGIGETVGTVANKLTSLTGEILAAPFDAAQGLISAIDWNGIGETVGTVANKLTSLTGEILAAPFDAAQGLISAIDWTGIGTTAGNVANGLTSLTGEGLSAAFTAAHSLIGTIDWAGLGETVGTIANKLVSYSGEALAAPFEAAFGILKGIKWEEVGSAMQSGIGDVWSGLTGFVGGVLGGAGEAASGLGEGIGTAAAAAGEALAKLFGGDDAKQASEDLKKAMTDLETALKDGSESVKTASRNIGKDIRESIGSEMTGDAIKPVGKTALIDILTGMGEGKDPLYAGIGALASAGADKFKGVGWSSVGSAIVTGIISGIQAASGRLEAQMQTLARKALASAKGALGINSPSRVMRDEVGLSIAEGIAMGITDNNGIVGDAMTRLAGDMTGTNINGMLAAQGGSFGSMSSFETAGAAEDRLYARIVQAVRDGMQGADLTLYMDGEKVAARMDEYLANEITAGRLA